MTTRPADSLMTVPWWQTAVIYQVYPRSFADSNGDGIGDLPGITSKLDYLAETLGVDAIWISPFYPSPMTDFGYDVSDYCDVDPRFGTLDDFDDLVAAAHAKAMRVIVDWVPNHTSDQHPWFIEARSSARQSQTRLVRLGRSGGRRSSPNNWLSVFGGSAWEWDEPTSQYYLHSFLESQPDLNWRNPNVKAAMFDTLRFWMDRDVDGFRIDVAHYLMKDPERRDNPPADANRGVYFKDLGDYEAFDHIHTKGHEDIHPVFRELRTVIDEYEDRFVIGEIHDWEWDAWARYYGDDLDELHMPFNFSLLYVPWDADEVRRRVDAAEAAIPNGGWPNHVLGNHDETRLASRFGADRARAAAMLLLTLRGTPTMYYGDELAMPNPDIAPADERDPWGLRVPGKGATGAAPRCSGLPAPEQASLMPTPNRGYRSVRAPQPATSPPSWTGRVRSCSSTAAYSICGGASLHCRPARTGPAMTHRPACISMSGRTQKRTAVVAINFSDRPCTIDLGDAELVLSTELDREPTSGSVQMRPNEGLIAFRPRTP